MRSEEIKSVDATVSSNPPPATQAAEQLAQQADEADALVQEFRKLLVGFESELGAEGVREQLQTLERWSESLRRGLKAAAKMSEVAPQWLHEAQDRLKLAADELQRMDAESPAAPGADHTRRAEEYMHAMRSIDALFPVLDQTLEPLKAPDNDNHHTRTEEKEHATVS
jgi:hypothetical protein